MKRVVVGWFVTVGLLSAQDHVADLRAEAWRVRNAAARALAAVPDAAFDVTAVVAGMTSPWQGPELQDPGRYGGRSRPSRQDPLQRVLLDAAEEVAGRVRVSAAVPDDAVALEVAAQLVVPWHPHELAAWLLQQRTTLHPAVAKALQEVPLVSQALGRTWLRVRRPDLPALLARADDGSDLGLLAQLLWHEGAAGRTTLRALLAHEALPWRRTVLSLGDPELLADDATLRAALAQFLGDPDPQQARQAGFVLQERGAAAVPLVVDALQRPGAAPRVLALLCGMAEAAGDAGGALAPFLTGNSGAAMERALAVIARAPVAAAHRPALAAAVFTLLMERKSVPLRVLALDALANLGDGVDAAMRQQLLAMLETPAADGVRARLLGCLRRLGVPTALATQRKLAICAMVHATVDTWLAAADDGDAALQPLLALLAEPKAYAVRGACFARLAEAAPAAVTALLDSDQESVRTSAINALRAAGAKVPTKHLVALAQDPYPFVARTALAWLGERTDVAPHAEPVLTALAQHVDWQKPELATPLLATLAVPPAQWLQRLLPRLRRGEAWDTVRDLDPAVRRGVLRQLLGAPEPEGTIRARLLGELLRVGIAGDDEIAWVRAGLQAGVAEGFASGLAAAPALPATLHPDLERCIDAGLAARDAMEDASALGRSARLALLRAAVR